MSYSTMNSETGQPSRRPAPANYGPFIQGQVPGGSVNQGAMPSISQGDAIGAVMNQMSNVSLHGTGVGVPHGGATMPHGLPAQAYVTAPDPSMMYPGYAAAAVHLGMAQHDAQYNAAAFPPYPVHGSYAPTTFVPYPLMPYTPGRAIPYSERVEGGRNDVPGLENRRGSYSTTESTPATPFFGTSSDRGQGTRIATTDHSTYSTPSPQQIAITGMIGQVGVPKRSQTLDPEVERLLHLDPAIPRAVPAVFTPPQHIKTVEQCLENRIVGNRNVYIRGLHPTTDDELLARYASRFGEVEQSKAIIDTSTGACKGFGFAKFKDVRNSEKCIRGFYHLGYEVGFARESFNARLKAEGDESSTNLYLSNLPKRLTEAELNEIFAGYDVISSKILRDGMGNSRGVGFARFDSRTECEEIIKKYHGVAVGEEHLLMQVRYADTPAQKELKRITAERRQFRTNEYNIGAYGTADVGIHPSIYTGSNWNRRSGGVGTTSNAPTRPAAGANVRGGPTSGQQRHVPVSSGTTSSEDGSGDEGVTIVDSPIIAKGSTQSSPVAVKNE